MFFSSAFIHLRADCNKVAQNVISGTKTETKNFHQAARRMWTSWSLSDVLIHRPNNNLIYSRGCWLHFRPTAHVNAGSGSP